VSGMISKGEEDIDLLHLIGTKGVPESKA